MSTKSAIEIELTAEQKEQLKQKTGKDVPTVKLSLVELEERLAPGTELQ